jgi:hypothetical protein
MSTIIGNFFLSTLSHNKITYPSGERTDMGSRNNKLISITKFRDIGGLPQFILLSHRYLQKGGHKPNEANGNLHKQSYMVPVDILALVLPIHMVKDIESMELGYGK